MTASHLLIVDKDAVRRKQLSEACAARGATITEAEDAFGAMAALGSSEFDALCAFAGPRHLSLRGLFQLAQRKRADVALWVLVADEDADAVEVSLGKDAKILRLSAGMTTVADQVTGAAGPAALDDGDVAVDDDTAAASTAVAPPPVAVAAPTSAEEVTAPSARAPSLDDFPVDVGLDDGADAAPSPEPPVPARASSSSFDEILTPAPAGQWDIGSGTVNETVDDTGSASSAEEQAPTGTAALIDAYARELTGRLVVGGGWRLYLYVGEPAWADPPGGDSTVFERLVAKGLLPVDAQPASVVEGELVVSLVASGALVHDAAVAFMRQLVFDATLEVASLEAVDVELEELPQLLSSPPPFRINPFGLVLESRRRKTRPEELIATARELAEARITPRRGLDALSGKVAPFARGVDVRSALEGGATLRSFTEAAGVDDLHATQLVLALEAAGLVHVERPGGPP